jgi:F0F1-type ATP synthase membrane subunit b/b'
MATGETPDDAAQRMEALLADATNSMRVEVERLVRTGEASFERMARQLVETLAREMLARIMAGVPAQSDGAASLNQAAALLTQAVQRGSRFT